MKKTFDSVGIMRRIRKTLSEKYTGKPGLEQRELLQAKARFEKQPGASRHVRVAERGAMYGKKTNRILQLFGSWETIIV